MLQFASRLQKLRKEKKISQETLAKFLHISRKQISQYETGKDLPGIRSTIKLADYFKVPIEYILGFASSTDQEEFWVRQQKTKRLQMFNEPTGELTYRYFDQGKDKESVIRYSFGIFSKKNDMTALAQINKERKIKKNEPYEDVGEAYRFFIIEELSGDLFGKMFGTDTNAYLLAFVEYLNDVYGIGYQVQPDQSTGDRVVHLIVKSEQLPPVNKYEKFIALGDQLDVDTYRKMINEQNCFLEINTMYGTDVFAQSLDVHSLVLMMDYYNFSIEEKKQIMAGCIDEAYDW